MLGSKLIDHPSYMYDAQTTALKASARQQSLWQILLFSARQHICYSTLYAIARPSVCLSVRPSLCLSHGWISQRRL